MPNLTQNYSFCGDLILQTIEILWKDIPFFHKDKIKCSSGKLYTKWERWFQETTYWSKHHKSSRKLKFKLMPNFLIILKKLPHN